MRSRLSGVWSVAVGVIGTACVIPLRSCKGTVQTVWLSAAHRLRGDVVHCLARLVVPARLLRGRVTGINKGEEGVGDEYRSLLAIIVREISHHSSTSHV